MMLALQPYKEIASGYPKYQLVRNYDYDAF